MEKENHMCFENNRVEASDMNGKTIGDQKMYWVNISDLNEQKQERREEDEPPPVNTISFCDRVYRMVHGVKAYLSVNPWGESFNLYTGIGRRTIGMERSIQFPICTD